MQHAITIGDILYVSGIAFGVFIVLGGLLYILAAYSRGMSR